MGFPARWRTAAGGSGDLTAAPVAGTTTPGVALATAGIEPGTLSLHATVDAETSTLTLTVKLQVSDDGATWYDLAGDAQNPANVALATGTAGADAAVDRVFPVPPAALGWRYVRAAVVNGVATGGAADTYAFTWHYRFASAF
jgi:hypothetical protein